MDTKTEVKSDVKTLEGDPVGGAEIVRIDTPATRAMEPTVWDASMVDLIKKTVCPQGIPDGEFRLFLEKCKASGMNPLLGECFCVPRNVKVSRGGQEQWVTQFVFQPAEQGMEARADRFPDFRGLRAAAVYAKDQIEIDSEAGTVTHKFNPVADRGALIGAWAIVYREGRKTPVEFVRVAEYRQQNAMWAAKTETMIVKCARAAALRRAYPQPFSGIYVAEEVEQPDAAPALPATTATNTATKELGAELAKKLGKPRPTPPQAAEPATDAASATTPTTPASEAPLAKYGPHRDIPMSALDAEQLAANIAFVSDKLKSGAEKVKAKPNDKAVAAAMKALEQELTLLDAERAARATAVGEDTPDIDGL
ncbi:MAG: phage recombination protein Bet [Myxococcota bacterium]